jgi:hypothetical protein
VDRSWLFSAKEDKFGSISRKGQGIGVLDAEGILFIDYLEKGKTITGEYCSHLFPKFKLFHDGQGFSSNQEAIVAVDGYFADLTKNHYSDGIMALEHRWNKCISVKGNYVEK